MSLVDDCLSIAPMIQWTDRHWRYFMRQITRKTVLYTEMTMDSALVYNSSKLEPFLGHDSIEYPLVIQLGGNDPTRLGEAASLCESYGKYYEINLNCGCPSNRARKAGFGAELMLEPHLVRQICHEMKRRVTSTDITVKCRLGVTGKDSFDDLVEFVTNVRSAGVEKIILHARNCVLKGLTPAQNRTVPPLHPELVHRIAEMFPDLKFIINGGITTFHQAKQHLGQTNDSPYPNNLYGVMIGREAYNNPFLFASADSQFFDVQSICTGKTKEDILHTYLEYAHQMKVCEVYGSNTCNIIKPLHNFFHGHKTNNLYKQKLDVLLKEHSKAVDKGEKQLSEIVLDAIQDTIPNDELTAQVIGPD